jgi:hypothetical protein
MKPDGWIEVFNPDGTSKVMETYKCCHCQKHCIVNPGTGKRRGYCMRCNRKTCGDPACDPCHPWQKKLEEIELIAQGKLRA